MLSVKLSPLSGKGKNRIREHGDTWNVVKSEHPFGFDAIMVQSVLTGSIRWVDIHDDPDFDLIVIT